VIGVPVCFRGAPVPTFEVAIFGAPVVGLASVNERKHTASTFVAGVTSGDAHFRSGSRGRGNTSHSSQWNLLPLVKTKPAGNFRAQVHLARILPLRWVVFNPNLLYVETVSRHAVV